MFREYGRRIVAQLDPGRPRLPLLFALGLSVALLIAQASTLDAPIQGEHDWRQADTYSVVYNIVHEAAPFLYPRIDWTQEQTGIMGMEAPVYATFVAALMRIVGDSPLAGRLFNWLALVAALGSVVVSFRLAPVDWQTRARGSQPNPLWLPIGIVTFAMLSPLWFFEGRQFQPDPAMAAFTTLAASCFYRFAQTQRWAVYVAGMLCYCVAVTAKSPALVAGPALWLLTFTASPRLRWHTPVVRGLPFLLPLALYAAWAHWARHLNATFAFGSSYFMLELDWDQYLRRIRDPEARERFFWFVVPSYASNWVLLPLLATGLALGFRRGLRAVSLPMLTWLLMGVGLCAGLERLTWHWYYAFMFMLPLCYFGGVGLALLFEACEAYLDTTRFVAWAFWFATFALLATPWAGGPATTLGHVIGATGPPGDIGWTCERGFFGLFVLQLLALGFVASTRWHGNPSLRAFALAVAVYVAVPRAVHDEWQIFLHRSRASERADFRTHWKELRSAVDELSTRQDKFVVDGGNPWFLHLILRKGFVHTVEQIDKLGRTHFAMQRLRYYVHFPQNGALPRAFRDATPVRIARRWQIYCVSETDCP